MKKCYRCGIVMELSNFTKDKSRKDGLKINCIECCRKIFKEYSLKNKDKERDRMKKYNKEKRIIDKESIKEYKRNYYISNKESIKNKKKDYQRKNKEINHKKRMDNKIRRLNENLGCSIRFSLKKIGKSKSKRTHEVLGCSPSDLKLYIESKFESWMNWDNWGLYNGNRNYGWDIDHIIPISSAETEEDVYRLNHYTNLQPLCSYVNRYIKIDNI